MEHPARDLTRWLFTTGAGALLALLGVGSLHAGAPAQETDTRSPVADAANAREVADDVFVIGDHRVWLVPNIGIVLGSEAALVIDAGLGPANGDLGGRKVELQTYGLAHTRGDRSVHLPGKGILFASDLIEKRIFPYLPPEDTELGGARWASVLRGFEALSPRIIIRGHDDPDSIRIAQELATHIGTVRVQVRNLKAVGLTATQILTEFKPWLVTIHPDWDHPQLAELEISYNASPPL